MAKRIKKKKAEVFYYHGSTPLVIVTKWSPNPNPLYGGVIETTHMLTYGQGIDLELIGLKRERPTDAH